MCVFSDRSDGTVRESDENAMTRSAGRDGLLRERLYSRVVDVPWKSNSMVVTELGSIYSFKMCFAHGIAKMALTAKRYMQYDNNSIRML